MKKNSEALCSIRAEYQPSPAGRMGFLIVPEKLRRQFTELGITRFVATVGELKPFHCAILPRKNGEGLIFLNKARRIELGLQEGDFVELSIRPDESEYGAPIPEELEALLEQDDGARQKFDALTPGQQRELIFKIERIKSTDARISAAIKHLRDN